MKQLSYKIIPGINTRTLYVSHLVQLSIRNAVARKISHKITEPLINLKWTIRNKL
jgi:hypothetical protein